MSANFTPDKGAYKSIGSFRHWSQKVLPAVYDDSLSYYELLAKVVNYLNDVIENTNVMGEDVTHLYEAYTMLEGFVNDYFNSLDVQQEINNKLDTMSENGELTELLAPVIPTVVTQWLNENVTPTAPVVDKSLTIDGAAADALVVGTFKGKVEVDYLSLNTDTSVAVPSGADFNDYKTAGSFKVGTAEIASTIANMPTPLGGRLFIFYTNQTTRLMQIFVANTPNSMFYVRFFNGSEWGVWNTFANTFQIDEVGSTSFTLEGKNGVEIPANSNIDNYKDVGNYKILTYATAQTIQNLPFVNGGRLTVYSVSVSSTYRVQEFVPNGSTVRKYMRIFDGTSWSSWQNIILSTEFNELKSSAIKSSGVLITNTNFEEYFTDFNDAPVNSVYNIAYGVELLNAPPGVNLLNQPTDTAGHPAGTLITFSGSSGSVRGRTQFFTTHSTLIAQSILYFRTAYTDTGELYWSPWQRFSDVACLTASNTVIRSATASRYFTNLDNAPVNSIYQIDLDCVEGVLENHPMAGVSCVLITLGFSFVSRHGMVQMCFGIPNGEVALCFRYGYKQSDSEYIWTSWKKVLTE